jgi:transcriptional regulator with XRE-family HTH domain
MSVMNRAPSQTDVLVGARVRFRRVELGLSQTALAERLGVTFQQVQKYERGTNRIGAGRLQVLARALDVPISYFFDTSDDPATVPTANALQLLSVPGALQLLRDYARLDPAARRAIGVVVGAAAQSADPPAPDPDSKSH